MNRYENFVVVYEKGAFLQLNIWIGTYFDISRIYE